MPSMNEQTAWYILSNAQLGARAALRLLEIFQHPQQILDATPSEWTQHAKLSDKGRARLLDAINQDHAQALARMQQDGITMVTMADAAYPARLRAIPDPPLLLFVKGTLPPPESQALSLVGSRSASPYGRHVAAELACALAQRGFVIISGMALGVDAAAHEGCLRAGGVTIAVLGSGVDRVYPLEHQQLYHRIAAAGAIVSEFPPGTPPARTNFPVRNRIISGMSLGVIVVEAGEKSGALITADHALEQGRDVFAVPGSVNSTQSRGTHRLLRDGAKLVESVDDILEELQIEAIPVRRTIAPLSGPSWELPTEAAPLPTATTPVPDTPRPVKRPLTVKLEEPAPAQRPASPSLPPEEATLLALLSSSARHVDDLIEASGLTPAQVNASLLMLELKGFAQRRPGNQYIRLS